MLVFTNTTFLKHFQLLSCLRGLDPGLLSEQLTLFTQTSAVILQNPFIPTIDAAYASDPFLPDFPEALIASGQFADVPVLIGDNKDDGILFMADFLRHPHKLSLIHI